jgi:hypothetical protein
MPRARTHDKGEADGMPDDVETESTHEVPPEPVAADEPPEDTDGSAEDRAPANRRWAFLRGTRKAARGAEAKPKAPRKTRWAIILIVSLVLVAALAVAGWEWHSTPGFCGTACHGAMGAYVDNYEKGKGMARLHKAAGVACLDCHSPTLGDQLNQVVAYVGGDYKTPLKQRKYGNKMCTKCHIGIGTQADKTDLLARNPHSSPHEDQRCSTCHKSHGPMVDYCSTCHPNGGQRMITYPLKPHPKPTIKVP